MRTVDASLSLQDYRSDAGLNKWLRALGIPDAPVRRKGLRTALGFLAVELPALRPIDALDLIAAMDLSKPAGLARIEIGEHLIAARTAWEASTGPRRLFFTRPGRSMHSSGISAANRRFAAFTARVAFDALETYTTSAIDTWTPREGLSPLSLAIRADSVGLMVAGGNVQLIIPHSQTRLIEQFGKP